MKIYYFVNIKKISSSERYLKMGESRIARGHDTFDEVEVYSAINFENIELRPAADAQYQLIPVHVDGDEGLQRVTSLVEGHYNCSSVLVNDPAAEEVYKTRQSAKKADEDEVVSFLNAEGMTDIQRVGDAVYFKGLNGERGCLRKSQLADLKTAAWKKDVFFASYK